MGFVNGEKDFLVIVVALVLFALFILPFHRKSKSKKQNEIDIIDLIDD